MMELTGYQRNFLRKKAHDLSPVVMLGKNGLSEEVAEAADKALEDHELIKVRFVDYKDERQVLARSLSEKLKATLVSVIGNVAILYRRSNDPGKQDIHIPGTHKK